MPSARFCGDREWGVNSGESYRSPAANSLAMPPRQAPHRPNGSNSMRIAMSGSTGLIGTAVAARLVALGHEILPIRFPRPQQGPEPPEFDKMLREAIASSAGMIHLSGENVSTRWTA